MKPRKPGSQVAPGQRPNFTNRPTASTHSKIPIDQATAGKLYRVRDRHDGAAAGKVWGEGLTWAEANVLKERVVAARKSKTARVEDMAIPMPDGAPAAVAAPAAPAPRCVTCGAAAPAAGCQECPSCMAKRDKATIGSITCMDCGGVLTPVAGRPDCRCPPAATDAAGDDTAGDVDLHDLDLGGFSDDDIAHAKRARDAASK